MAVEAPPVSIPLDDPAREATLANPEAESAEHICVVGDTYTILVSGEDTAGRYALIDMHVPNGGGPPPHRHDFEECSPSSRARSRSPSAARGRRRGPGTRSTSRPTLRTSPAPELDPDTKAERMKKALALAPKYRTELLLP
jgi:hypothetical protein